MAEDKTAAEFAIRLRDEMSGSAQSAAQALEQLRAQIQLDSAELASMQKAMRNLQQGTSVDIKAFRELKDAIDKKRQSVGQAQAAYVQLGGTFSRTAPKASSLSHVFGELSKQSSSLPGPLGGIVSRLSVAVSGMSSAALITAGLAAGFVALSVAAAAATKSLFDEAVSAQDARRNELLHFDALTKTRNLWGVLPGKASDMQDAVDKVSASVSIGRDKVAGYAGQLYQSGLRGANLAAALEGTAIKASALGDAAGSGFASWAVSMGRAGVSVKRLSDDVKARFGGVVQKQMLSLEVQARKQREGFASLFTGLNIEPYLNAMARLRNMFSQNEASGQALKQLVTLLLKPLLEDATIGATIMRRFFKQMIIGVQEITIAYLIARNWFRETFGVKQTHMLSDLFGKFQAGRVVVYILAAAFTAMGISLLGVLIPAVFSLAAAFTGALISAIAAVLPVLGTMLGLFAGLVIEALILAAPFLAVAAAVAAVGLALYELYQLWQEIDFKLLGKYMWQGIVDGITSGLTFVKSAVSNLATSAWDTFKHTLGISSPSKVFATLGLAIPEGITQGVHTGTPDARDAVSGIIVPPTAPDLGGSALGNTAQSAPAAQPAVSNVQSRANATGNTISIGELHIHAESSEPKTLAGALRREIESIFEGAALQIGTQTLGET